MAFGTRSGDQDESFCLPWRQVLRGGETVLDGRTVRGFFVAELLNWNYL